MNTAWITDLRDRWLAQEARSGKVLNTASHLSGTAHCARMQAMTWKHAWAMARLYRHDSEFLAYCRSQMRQAARECVALARHYVLETERQKRAEQTRREAVNV